MIVVYAFLPSTWNKGRKCNLHRLCTKITLNKYYTCTGSWSWTRLQEYVTNSVLPAIVPARVPVHSN